MNATMGDILQLTNLWDVEHSSYVKPFSQLTNLRESPYEGFVVPAWDRVRNVEMTSSMTWVRRTPDDYPGEKWSVELGRACGWAQGERGKSQKCWAHHHVNINKDDVMASSEQQSWREDSRWFSCWWQWESRSVEWTCLWTSTGERVKTWFICVMQWNRSMASLWMCP
jgi:hypothetical protein